MSNDRTPPEGRLEVRRAPTDPIVEPAHHRAPERDGDRSPFIPLDASEARNAIVSAISCGSTARCADRRRRPPPRPARSRYSGLGGLADEVVRHLGLRPARENRVARDAVCADVLSDRPHQSQQPVSGGAVTPAWRRPRTRPRSSSRPRSDEAALDHVATRAPDELERPCSWWRTRRADLRLLSHIGRSRLESTPALLTRIRPGRGALGSPR